jgi:hypothetical protein
MTPAPVAGYAEFVAGIRFHPIRPETPLVPESYQRAMAAFAARGTFVDVENTTLPWDDAVTKALLHDLFAVPRMSTLAIAAIINRGVGAMEGEAAFVNVGVWHGFTLLAGMAGNPARRCVGIDNFSQFLGPRAEFYARFRRWRTPQHAFYEMDYRDYFAHVHEGPIGFYLYDGDHGYDDQLQGLQLAEPFFAERCLVLVDDTNCAEPRQATLDFMARSRSTWRVLLDRTTAGNGHPTLWNGVMLLQRQGARS